MPYIVYILFSPKHNRHYIGQTNNIANRLIRHNAGHEKATAPYSPWELIWYTEKITRAEAMTLERKLKNLSTQRLLRFIQK